MHDEDRKLGDIQDDIERGPGESSDLVGKRVSFVGRFLGLLWCTMLDG
jgi:hypothetical protein